MGREMSDNRGMVVDAETFPGPEALQAAVDDDEASAVARYQRLQDYTTLIRLAMRRDAAMSRLELALRGSVAA